MLGLREALLGRWRAVPVLAVTQILAWGTMFFPVVLIVPSIAAERGWSTTFAMSGFSAGLLTAGLLSPYVGSAIDRHGGHRVMAAGSLIGAAGLMGLAYVSDPTVYVTLWIVLGAAMSASLYDPAFAALGRIFGSEARPAIAMLTFMAGFASTVSWPLTYFLLQSVGWRGTYIVYGCLLAVIAAPLLGLALPRSRAEIAASSSSQATGTGRVLPTHGAAFVLVASAFAAHAFIFSGLSAHLIAVFDRLGLDRGTVVAISALIGPTQMIARLSEFLFARNIHPLWVARFAVAILLFGFVLLAIFGLSAPTVAIFVILFGAANGLFTIARGTVPLALFGSAHYGALVGRMAGPYLVMQALAPSAIAYVAEHGSDAMALAVVAGFALAAFACLTAVRLTPALPRAPPSPT